MGMTVDELEQLLAVEGEALGVFDGHRRGGTRTAVQQGDLTEDVAGLVVAEQDLVALEALDEDLDAPGADQVKAVPGIAKDEQGIAFTEMPGVEELAQGGALVEVEQG